MNTFRLLAVLLWLNSAAAGRGKPGEFDYYVLSLSWSPEFCASPAGRGDKLQCVIGRKFGFVVHGLWPQYERGYPQSCSTEPGPDKELTEKMLAIMPSPKLIRHEWQKHGTCSGLGVAKYFEAVQKARQDFQVPLELQSPEQTVSIEPAKLKKRFLEVNPGWNNKSAALLCGGRYLRELRVCLTKDLKSRDCGADVRDACKASKVTLRPVR